MSMFLYGRQLTPPCVMWGLAARLLMGEVYARLKSMLGARVKSMLGWSPSRRRPGGFWPEVAACAVQSTQLGQCPCAMWGLRRDGVIRYATIKCKYTNTNTQLGQRPCTMWCLLEGMAWSVMLPSKTNTHIQINKYKYTNTNTHTQIHKYKYTTWTMSLRHVRPPRRDGVIRYAAANRSPCSQLISLTVKTPQIHI